MVLMHVLTNVHVYRLPYSPNQNVAVTNIDAVAVGLGRWYRKRRWLRRNLALLVVAMVVTCQTFVFMNCLPDYQMIYSSKENQTGDLSQEFRLCIMDFCKQKPESIKSFLYYKAILYIYQPMPNKFFDICRIAIYTRKLIKEIFLIQNFSWYRINLKLIFVINYSDRVFILNMFLIKLEAHNFNRTKDHCKQWLKYSELDPFYNWFNVFQLLFE